MAETRTKFFLDFKQINEFPKSNPSFRTQSNDSSGIRSQAVLPSPSVSFDNDLRPGRVTSGLFVSTSVLPR